MNKKIYVLFDEISQEPIDTMFCNTVEQAVLNVENTITQLETKLGNKFKYRLRLYELGSFDPKICNFVKTFQRRK